MQSKTPSKQNTIQRGSVILEILKPIQFKIESIITGHISLCHGRNLWHQLKGVHVPKKTVEFFYNSLFPAKSWQDPASIDREEQNKKLPLLRIECTTSR